MTGYHSLLALGVTQFLRRQRGAAPLEQAGRRAGTYYLPTQRPTGEAVAVDGMSETT